MRKIVYLCCVFVAAFQFTAHSQPETREQRDERMQWWREARLGMFIHWGLYAIPAGEWNGKTGYGEWIRHSAQIPISVYDTFPKHFNPVKFDADEWVKIARDAGMKYIVITSKHHDGFCMFDSDQTSFDIMNTPYGKDVMKDLSAACKKYGLKFCFYHSIMDWHHPDYLPRRDWESDRFADSADYSRYLTYMKSQLKELLTNYGEIGVLWFDGEWESTWNEAFGKEIYAYCRSLQPGIIINNRVGAGRMDMEGSTKEGMFGGDFGTPEQQIPATGLPGNDWETCMTMNDHWGYNRHDKNFKTTTDLIRMISDISSKGGNYLLNVGPTAEGIFPPESIERLQEIGRWMKVNGEAVYSTQASPFSGLEWGRCTRKETATGTTLYFHVFEWPADGQLRIPGLLNDPVRVRILGTGNAQPVKTGRDEDQLILYLTDTDPDPVATVIAVEIAGRLDLTEPPDIISEFDVFIDSNRVTLFSDRPQVEIRYTLDGSEPSSNSSLYGTPLLLAGSGTVSARCFRGEKPVSGTVSREFMQVKPEPASLLNGLEPGLKYSYFEGAFDSLPDFTKLKPIKTGVTSRLDFSPRNQPENFSFAWNGYLNVPETGIYGFSTESDDGSALYIDGKKVVDNDGLHGRKEASGVISLEKGFHALRVEYFERTGSDELVVYVRSSLLPKQPLTASWLFFQPE